MSGLWACRSGRVDYADGASISVYEVLWSGMANARNRPPMNIAVKESDNLSAEASFFFSNEDLWTLELLLWSYVSYLASQFLCSFQKLVVDLQITLQRDDSDFSQLVPLMPIT